ncbi:LppX_LprAFG lipoprotein [Ilumatobacter nonamiensis]|uniref:LppX_LprAFG lipoprotein n=1 Tax=Ilumatobacter nonamiensis TaxID=467093 RepID=UPI000345AD63|nr:LppX_LprAFG lipoprotein [Ilumatobacter nonamiensis]
MTNMIAIRPLRRYAFIAAATAALAACGGDSSESEPTEPTIPPDAQAIVDASAVAMGDTESVRFELRRSGAPVYIDQVEQLALNSVIGQFEVPGSAQAVIEVEVDGGLISELGAVALDDEIWLSNPITGVFEPLPAGIDVDPSLFFDPENGWQPLMEDLTDVELVGIEERDGADRYHVTATAPAERVEVVTARLVRDQDVEIDFWIQPVTGEVRAAEFTADVGGDEVAWALELSEYGEDFDIEPPEGLGS